MIVSTVYLVAVLAVSTTKLLLSFFTNPIVWVTAITVVVIPLLTSAVTRPYTPDKFKTLISFALAGLYALVAWLGGIDGNVDWKSALVVFAVAAAGAGGINSAWVSGALSTWLGIRVPINLGPKPLTPEKAAELHSHGSGSTISVPIVSIDGIQMDPNVVAAERDPAALNAIKAQLDAS